MKRILSSALIFFLIASLLAGCSGNSSKKTTSSGTPPTPAGTGPVVTVKPTQMPVPEVTQTPASTSQTPVKSTTSTPASTPKPPSAQSPSDSTALPPTDPGMTLASLKKGAEAAGYKTDDGVDLSPDRDDRPAAAAGFNINYTTQNSQMQIMVFEFKTAQDAIAYAKYLNTSGDVVAIVNGKFATGTRAAYGIVEDDKQKDFLEKLMKSKVMAWPGFTPKSSYTKDYKGTLELAMDINTAYNIVLNRSVTAYLKTLPPNSPNIGLRMTYFATPFEGTATMYPAFCDNKEIVDQYLDLWLSFGVTDLKFDSKTNDYVMTGKRAGMNEAFNVHAQYDPANGAIRLVDITGDKQVFFYEFVPLGNNKYAVQSNKTRIIVEYRNGQVNSLAVSKNGAADYDAAKDSIYPAGLGANEAWVTKTGADSYEQVLSFDGKTIKLNVKGIFDKDPRIKIDIPRQ